MILDIFNSISGFFNGLFSIISNITDYILNIFSFISSIGLVVSSMAITFFTSMPSFISIGLLSIFSLGIIILIIKVIK